MYLLVLIESILIILKKTFTLSAFLLDVTTLHPLT